MKTLTWRFVTNVHVFNSFFFAYAEKVYLFIEFFFYSLISIFFKSNLPALQKLFEKMRKINIKPTLESYAAALSCLGSMDLFDPSIARRIILDLEKEVGL